MADETLGHASTDISEEDCVKAVEVLRQASFASFAVDEGRRPYVVPLNFVHISSPGPHGRLVFHTGRGRKSVALAANPRVCVTASTRESFVQGNTPCSDGFAFSSVVAEGSARLLEDPREKDEALRVLVARYDPTMADHPFDDGVLAKTLVYEVTIESLSYRSRH